MGGSKLKKDKIQFQGVRAAEERQPSGLKSEMKCFLFVLSVVRIEMISFCFNQQSSNFANWNSSECAVAFL